MSVLPQSIRAPITTSIGLPFTFVRGAPLLIHALRNSRLPYSSKKGLSLNPSYDQQRRYISSEIQQKDQQAGESNAATDTGIIQKSDWETLIYFDNIYPTLLLPRSIAFSQSSSLWNPLIWLNNLLLRRLKYYSSPEHIRKRIQRLASPPDNPIRGLLLRSIVPIKRDGGVFATFMVPRIYSKAEANSMIQQNTANESQKTKLSHILSYFFRVSAFPVKGTPWIEDLRRFPTTEIRIKFQGPPLTEEEIYSLFRRYGTIMDITPPHLYNNVQSAVIRYKSHRAAICAKNCVSGIEINNTTLHIRYEQPKNNGGAITSFFVNHTRIAVPLLVAFLSVFVVLVFDPIREFFIEHKITSHNTSSSASSLTSSFTYYQHSVLTSARHLVSAWTTKLKALILSKIPWISQSKSSMSISHPTGTASSTAAAAAESMLLPWDESKNHVEDLKMWLEENNNTFVIVRGPRGSGKRELVMQHTLRDRDNVLYLDCDKIIKARTDVKFLKSAAREIGYFPIVPWTGSITRIMDVLTQGLTGQKTGLSESKEAQFRYMLTIAMISIRRIALKHYQPVVKLDNDTTNGNDNENVNTEKSSTGNQKMGNSGRHNKKGTTLNGNVNGDEETTIIVKEEDYLQQHPEAKPVIVIDRFIGRSDMNAFVYKELADWAAMLVQMNIAHVIFLTETISSNQLLAEALPNQVFRTLILSDASRESARNYVISQLQDSKLLSERDASPQSAIIKELDKTLEPLGGRILDLQAFVRRVKSGDEPHKALEKMVEQASEQITQIFLSDKIDSIESAQAWELIEMLNDKPVVHFQDIVFRPLFKSAPELGVLRLENNGLITVTRDRGVLKEIRPAKPLFRAAFKYLINDKELSRVLKIRFYLKVISFETGRIRTWEEELRPLGKIADQKLFKSRLEYLSGKINLSNQTIKDCEAKIKDLSTS